MSVRRFVIVAMAAMAVGCGEPAPTEPVEIAEIINDVEYYIGCANEPVTVDGVTWYPLPDDEFADEVADIVAAAREAPGGARGFALRVAPPGLGDDIGTLVVYADGVARYESDSGQAIWLTGEELTYDWVC